MLSCYLTQVFLPLWRVAANIVNKQWRTADKRWRSSLGGGRGVTTPQRKRYHITNHSQRSQTRTGYDLNNGKGTSVSVHGMSEACIG